MEIQIIGRPVIMPDKYELMKTVPHGLGIQLVNGDKFLLTVDYLDEPLMASILLEAISPLNRADYLRDNSLYPI